ncbi:TatD family hydrolase [Halocola ammonii]
MKITDTHAHLYLKDFEEDLSEVMNRAVEAEVDRVYLPNIDSSTIPLMKKAVNEFPDALYPMMGLHPGSVDENYESELEVIEKELRAGKYYAVGEIGIDLYWEKKFINEQQDAFKRQIDWAKELGLPIVIHCREAFDVIFEVLDEKNDDKLFGIFHCFTGTEEQARRIIDYGGFVLGIGGIVTFKNAGLDKVVEKLSLDDLVVETDAPYLAPAPNRGKRNESAYTRFVAQKIADLHQVSLEKVAEVTSRNAQRIFHS